MSKVVPEIKVSPDVPALIQEAAHAIVEHAARAIATKGSFSIALSGGRTPKGLYEVLAAEPFRGVIEWQRVEIFFGDERCVPPDSTESNFRMANEALLSKVPIPGDNVYRMHGEDDPHKAAVEYGKMLKEKFGDGGIDLVLLGMGDDGHTASIFPGSEAVNEVKHRCVANFVQKFNTWRITMSAPFINRAETVIIMVTGADKTARVTEVLHGPNDPQRLPIQLIAPASGKLIWMLDAPAAGMVED